MVRVATTTEEGKKKRKSEEEMLMTAACSSESRSRSSLLPADKEALEDGSSSSSSSSSVADRISDLPDGILCSILSHLQLKELMRTSILSRRWRHVWTFAPLDITDYFVYGVAVDAGTEYLRDDGEHFEGHSDCYLCLVLRSMETILDRHRGPIHSFDLSMSFNAPHCNFHNFGGPLDYPGLFDRWTKALAQRGIQHLTLISRVPPYLNKLTPNLLACHSLHTLELVDFKHLDLQLPSSFPPNLRELKLHGDCTFNLGGALPRAILACQSLCSLELLGYKLREPFVREMPPNIRELRLWDCILSDSLLERLLSTCRLLDTLDLYESFGLKEVRISSSSLRKLRLRFVHKQRFPQHLIIGDVPNLQLLMLDDFFTDALTVGIIRPPYLRLPPDHFKHAYAKTSCLKNELPREPTIRQLYTLKALSVKVNLDDAIHAKLLGDLLRSFPCLEILDIEVCKHSSDPVDKNYWEHESSYNCLNHQLKVVKFKGFLGLPNHLHFAHYLVKNAQMLKVISFLCQLEHEKRCVELKIDTLTIERRASLDVKVIILSECSDWFGHKVSYI